MKPNRILTSITTRHFRPLCHLLLLLTIYPTGMVSAGNNVWTSVGPEGGAFQSLGIDPQDSNTMYAVCLPCSLHFRWRVQDHGWRSKLERRQLRAAGLWSNGSAH